MKISKNKIIENESSLIFSSLTPANNFKTANTREKWKIKKEMRTFSFLNYKSIFNIISIDCCPQLPKKNSKQ